MKMIDSVTAKEMVASFLVGLDRICACILTPPRAIGKPGDKCSMCLGHGVPPFPLSELK